MKKRHFRQSTGPQTHWSEQSLIEILDRLDGRLLCTTLGRAQLASVYVLRFTDRESECHVLDEFQAAKSRELQGDCCGRLQIQCTADFPDKAFDSAALPLSSTGESEFARERIQDAIQRLPIGGTFALSTNNPSDKFFDSEVQQHFSKVTRLPNARGVVYFATKNKPLKRIRDFSAEYAFRDGDELIRVKSRPGVFSHRRLDTGARALIEKIELPKSCRVLEIGCGAGPITAAILRRSDEIFVEAVDSNARALECTRATCELNGVAERVTTTLSAEARGTAEGTVDVVVANPPYFSKYRIAELFLTSAVSALCPKGKGVFVTRQPAWFQERMQRHFDQITVEAHRGYHIVSGKKR